MEEIKEHERMKLECFRQKIKVGLDQIECGEVFDGKDVFSQLDEALGNLFRLGGQLAIITIIKRNLNM